MGQVMRHRRSIGRPSSMAACVLMIVGMRIARPPRWGQRHAGWATPRPSRAKASRVRAAVRSPICGPRRQLAGEAHRDRGLLLAAHAPAPARPPPDARRASARSRARAAGSDRLPRDHADHRSRPPAAGSAGRARGSNRRSRQAVPAPAVRPQRSVRRRDCRWSRRPESRARRSSRWCSGVYGSIAAEARGVGGDAGGKPERGQTLRATRRSALRRNQQPAFDLADRRPPFARLPATET